MFTGIILHSGRIQEVGDRGDGRELWIEAPEIAAELQRGGSVSVNGCCLSAEEVAGDRFRLFCTPETLDRTTIGKKATGDEVNLELPLRPTDRLGGHFVQGHVDGVGEVDRVRELDGSWMFRFRAPSSVARYLVEKGSVAVDGISLTVASLSGGLFEVAVIPETWERTNLSAASPGTEVNLEADVLAKYVERLLAGGGSDDDRFAETFRRVFGDD